VNVARDLKAEEVMRPAVKVGEKQKTTLQYEH
jgi:hypothetical protein